MELIKLIDLKELMDLTKFIELLEGDGVCGLVDLIDRADGGMKGGNQW